MKSRHLCQFWITRSKIRTGKVSLFSDFHSHKKRFHLFSKCFSRITVVSTIVDGVSFIDHCFVCTPNLFSLLRRLEGQRTNLLRNCSSAAITLLEYVTTEPREILKKRATRPTEAPFPEQPMRSNVTASCSHTGRC